VERSTSCERGIGCIDDMTYLPPDAVAGRWPSSAIKVISL
jgi:hypothetical protein